MGLDRSNFTETQDFEPDSDRMIKHKNKCKKKTIKDYGKEKWDRKKIKQVLKRVQYRPS